MGKKRKGEGKPYGQDGEAGFERPTKLAVRSWEDVADSDDEFHLNRDKILLEEEPARKRQRKIEEELAQFEPSDEEVLAEPDDLDEYYDEMDEELDEAGFDDEDYSESEVGPNGKVVRRSQKSADAEEDSDMDGDGWGSSKRDYYNADRIETEADALEEEQEALRLQRKQLQGMTAADYGFDEEDWLGSGKVEDEDDEEDGGVEILPDVEITEDMKDDEKDLILSARYPEFKPLAKEYLALEQQYDELLLASQAAQAVLKNQAHAENLHINPATIKFNALSGYLGVLAMYFSLLSSGPGGRKPNPDKLVSMPATQLRAHPIMENLGNCRKLWEMVKDMVVPDPSVYVENVENHDESDLEYQSAQEAKVEVTPKPTKKPRKNKAERAEEAAKARRAEEMQRTENDFAKLSERFKSRRREPLPSRPVEETVADDSDFGEETELTREEAEEKAQRKKGLRFYTSQITQKANKRSRAAQAVSGDADIPHRERLRDRQARLNAEAEARGRKKLTEQEELGGESDEEDARAAQDLRNGPAADDEDDYYDYISQKSKGKKEAKAAKAAAVREAAAQGAQVREVEEIGPDGKRAITYAIEKNKGLTPKRKKDVRNPRVKKRKKYDEKKKKLSSIRAVYKGGEGRGGYKGELTGIKQNLVKSIKL